MPIRVLVVDDSPFYRRRLAGLLESDPDIQVIGEAENGRQALARLARLDPDLVTMDVEMPEMDGIEAVRRIMAEHPRPILMFSSLTHAGARATLDALEAGAADFLPKDLREITTDPAQAGARLCRHVRELVRGRRAPPPAAARTRPQAPRLATGVPRLLIIGASTGGPVAVHRLLTGLPADFPVPVLIVQHMPGSFTPSFARRLDEYCRLAVHEARDGDPLLPGMALVAPGGRQVRVTGTAHGLGIRLEEPAPGASYAPCLDIALESGARVLGPAAHAVILTGMGADGSAGAAILAERGGRVWAQAPAECVVPGMPQAAMHAGCVHAVLTLEEMGAALAGLTGRLGRRALP